MLVSLWTNFKFYQQIAIIYINIFLMKR